MVNIEELDNAFEDYASDRYGTYWYTCLKYSSEAFRLRDAFRAGYKLRDQEDSNEPTP